MAQQVGFSPYHFHRVFTQFVGEPLRQHVRRLRLEHGAYRLKISEDTILQPGSALAALWDALFHWARPRGLVDDKTLLLGIPQDDPTLTPPPRRRFDVAIHIPYFHEPQGNIGLQTLTPGLYAVGRHYGSFDHLAATYAHIFTTVVAPDSYRLRPAPPFEIYAHTRIKDDLTIHYTDVYMPVEPDNRSENGG